MHRYPRAFARTEAELIRIWREHDLPLIEAGKGYLIEYPPACGHGPLTPWGSPKPKNGNAK